MATAAFTSADIDPVLKEHYTDDEQLALSFNRKNTFLAKVKRKKSGGRKFIQPLDYARPGGGSATFATAQAGYLSTKYEQFELQRAKYYLTPQLDNESILATQSSEDAFVPILSEIDRSFRSIGDQMEFRMFRDKGGTIGRSTTATNVATAVMTIEDRADLHQFRPGMVVKLVAAKTGGSLRTGSLTVASIDRDAGTVTYTGNITAGVAAAVNTDYVVPDGDYDAGILGLEDWIPYDRSGLGTAFMGVTRSVDAQLLAGNYLNGTGGAPLNEVLLEACGKISDMGGMANAVFMNTATFTSLQKLLEGKVSIDRVAEKVNARIGFTGFRLSYGEQDLTIYPTRACPSKRMFVLDWSTWFLHSAGSAPRFLLENAGYNSIVYPSPTADSFECRIGYYANLGCSAPGWNCTVAL